MGQLVSCRGRLANARPKRQVWLRNLVLPEEHRSGDPRTTRATASARWQNGTAPRRPVPDQDAPAGGKHGGTPLRCHVCGFYLSIARRRPHSACRNINALGCSSPSQIGVFLANMTMPSPTFTSNKHQVKIRRAAAALPPNRTPRRCGLLTEKVKGFRPRRATTRRSADRRDQATWRHRFRLCVDYLAQRMRLTRRLSAARRLASKRRQGFWWSERPPAHVECSLSHALLEIIGHGKIARPSG